MQNCGFNSDIDVQTAHWVQNTRLFRQWEAMKQEILRHKWIESEKAGYDIGWERACVDWMIRFGHCFPKGQDR